MSWDVDLYIPIESAVLVTDDGERTFAHPRFLYGSWSYTHNTSPMIYATLPVARPGWDRSVDGPWYRLLDRETGADGAELLDRIVNCLMELPEHFRAMNPENGWGDYDSLLVVLAEMRDAGREHPTALWAATG